MTKVILALQIIFALFLIGCILLQARGTGLGSAWGGGGESYRSKRGVEKIVFTLTIIFAFLFLIFSIISAFIV